MRKPVLAYAAAAAIACSALLTAPSRATDAIKILVPFAAGGPADMLARVIGQELQQSLGTSVVVENRGGAGGVLAMEVLARSAPDGKTILLGTAGSHVLSSILQPSHAYDPLKSFEPIALVGTVSSVLVVNNQVPANSLPELITLAKSGRKLSYGSAGGGSTMNIAGEQLNIGAHISVTNVPYRGAGPAINDLLGGHVDMIIADPPVIYPLVAGKSARALAVFGAERSPLLRDVPTTKELGFPDMVMDNWYGVIAPAGLPPEVSASLEKAILAALQIPRVKERLAAGGLVGTTGRQGFRARLDRDFAYWRPQIKKLGITLQ